MFFPDSEKTNYQMSVKVKVHRVALVCYKNMYDLLCIKVKV